MHPRQLLLAATTLLAVGAAAPARAAPPNTGARLDDLAEDLDPLGDATLDDDDFDLGDVLDPLGGGGGSLGFSILGAFARTQTYVGSRTHFQVGLVLHLPLDRIDRGRVVLRPTPRLLESADETESDVSEPDNGAPMTTKRSTLSALAFIPAAIAAGTIVEAKETRAPEGPAAAASSSVSASSSISAAPPARAIVTTSEASVAGVIVVIAAPAALSASTVHALIDAAWRATGLESAAALDDLASRARSSAFAPEVRLRVHRTLNNGGRVLMTDTLADRTTLTDGTQTFLEARLTWRLDRLVFADEEVSIERAKLDRAELKQRIAMHVVDLALTWQRARRAAANIDLLPEERDEAAARAIEAQLALDAYTGGEASALLPR